MTHQTDTDVLIVGAGPSGLTMACLLARYGVKFRIVDKKDTTTTRSKALGIQARTLELFEQLGLTKTFLSMGHPATGLDLIISGKLRASIDIQKFGLGLTKYPYILILEQSKTEKLLLEKLNSGDHKIEWLTELVDIKQHVDFVEASVMSSGKMECIRAKYVIGVDGAKSSLRHELQIPFLGGTYENRFLLADVAMKWDHSREHVTLCLSRQGFAGFFPMVGTDRYRAIGTMSDETPSNADEHFEEISAEIKKQADVPLQISDPLWISTYKLHHRCVTHFQVGRCFLAGDAAHVHSPAGAQGMNTGMQDAFNLAWKLQMVLSGLAGDRLLKTYHEERFPFAKRLVRTTDQVFLLATSRNIFLKGVRLWVLPLILKFVANSKNLRRFMFKTISQIGIQYRHYSLSHSNFTSRQGLRAGDRFIAKDSEHNDGLFHAFIAGPADAQSEVTQTLQRFLKDHVKVHVDETLTGMMLVRPDQYIAYMAETLNALELSEYLRLHYLTPQI